MNLNQEEIWREGSKIVIDYDSRRINVTSVGDFDVEKARRCKAFMLEIFGNSDSYFDLVIDIKHETKSSRGARKIWKEINAHPKVRFVALCGVVSFTKLIHTFVIGFRKHPQLRLFVNKKEAFTWLEGLVENIRSWFDANKGELPSGNQEIVMAIDGTNYIGHFDKNKRIFRVDDELQDLTFSTDRHRIMWKPYNKPTGRVEQISFMD